MTQRNSKNIKVNKKPELNELEKLYVFLKKYKTNDIYTHKLLYEPYGKYNIPDEKNDQFMKLYENAIIAKNILSIAEKHNEYGQIVIELNFNQEKCPSPDIPSSEGDKKQANHEVDMVALAKRDHDSSTIKTIIELYNKIIKKYLDVRPNHMFAFVLEIPPSNSNPKLTPQKKTKNISGRNKEYHNTIRIIYPYICTKPSLQILMRKELMDLIMKYQVLKNVSQMNILDEIFNEGIIYRHDWIMYGSRKNPYVGIHKLTHIYGTTNSKIYDTLLPDEINDENFTKYIINQLSIRKFKIFNATQLNTNINSSDIDAKINPIKYQNKKMNNESVSEDKLEKFCEQINLINNLYDLGGVTDYNLAKIFNNIFPNLFIYDPLATYGGNKKEGTWLTYDEYGKYHICDGMEKAKNLLSTEIYELLKKDFDQRLEELKTSVCDNKEAQIKNLIKSGTSIFTKLKNTVNKCHIIEQLKELYRKDKIFESLDEINHYLIGFDNGVYDLENKTFRKANVEEMMYNTVGYDYKEPKQTYVDELNEFIKSIYPDEKEKKYIMTTFSFGLVGVMHLQEFYMLIGNGGNGKGLITLLVNITLGKTYCTNISIECFKNNGNISSNEKSQQLAGCISARIVFITESDFKENEEFESSLLKKISGGDEQNCKFLYKEQSKYIPKFNLYFVTNDQIPMKIKDRSIPRRARICPHRISFMEKNEYDKNNSKQALAIPGLEEKFRKDPEYKYAFFKILLNYYYEFINDDKKLEIPQTLIDENINFKNLNDPIGNFINDCLVITKNANDKVKTSIIYLIFKEYCRETKESFKSIKQYFNKRDIKTSLNRGYSVYCGIKFKDYDNLTNNLNSKAINTLINNGLIKGKLLEITDNDIEFLEDK
jgi:P4 family phage/plasmid primase-like protien